MKGDLLKGIAQVEFSKTDRRTKKTSMLKLPCFYYDCFSIGALYSASAKLVQQHLPDPQMHPIAFFIMYGKKGLPFISL